MGFIEKIVGLMNNSNAPEQEKTVDSAETPPQEQTAAPADEAALKGTQEPKNYTPEELETLFSEKKKEWQEEQNRMEQERIQSLPEAERLKQELILKETEISQLKAEQEKRDLKTEVIAKLEERRLPASVADILSYSDRESTLKSLDKIMGVFESLVQEGVNNRLRGKTPSGLGGAAQAENGLYRDPFAQAFIKNIKQ